MTNEDTQHSDGIITRIVYLPDRYVDLIFVLSLLAFTIGTIYFAFRYDANTRALPVLTAVATTVLIGYLLLSNRSKYFAFRYRSDGDRDEDGLETRRKSVFGFLWVITLTGLVLLVGMELGIFAFLLAYYRLQSNLSWKRTIAYSVAIWGLIIVLFGFIVQVPLYEGYLFGQL